MVLPQDLLRWRRTPEIQDHSGFVPDGPTIMARRYAYDISGSKFPLSATVELTGHMSREAIEEMVYLT